MDGFHGIHPSLLLLLGPVRGVQYICVVFVLAILSNNGMADEANGYVCVVFVLAILSNMFDNDYRKFAFVLYLF